MTEVSQQKKHVATVLYCCCVGHYYFLTLVGLIKCNWQERNVKTDQIQP